MYVGIYIPDMLKHTEVASLFKMSGNPNRESHRPVIVLTDLAKV